MSKKKPRQARQRNKPSRVKADEIIQRGPLTIARYGRFVQIKNTATNEEHDLLMARMAEENPRIHAELGEKISNLQNLISKYDPVQLMHRAAYVVLPLFLKHRSENEYTSEEVYSLPGIEYIQYLLARTGPNTTGKPISEDEWDELWNTVCDILKLTGNHLFTRRVATNPPTPIEELRAQLDLSRLMIRVNHYQVFLEDYWRDSLEPYDTWLREILGVGASDIICELNKLQEYFKTGVLGRYRILGEAQKRLMLSLSAQGAVFNLSVDSRS